jgi:transposase
MTYVGLDVHARSTHAAAIEVYSGELRRARFGVGDEAVIEWLLALPAPVRACYEAGPTGFALYRAAAAAGVSVEVVAPSKTPRAPGDRIKTDRKDAELLARLLLAGQLKFVVVPSPSCEAARHLCRAREQVRSDLLRCRHRLSKLLLLHGRVYPQPTPWTKTHRRWLQQQRFQEAATELTYADAGSQQFPPVPAASSGEAGRGSGSAPTIGGQLVTGSSISKPGSLDTRDGSGSAVAK